MIVPGLLVCSSFLIIVCMFIVPKALLMSSAAKIVHAGGAIWLNPLLRCLLCIVPSLLSVVFVTVLLGCVQYICSYVRMKTLLQCLCNY